MKYLIMQTAFIGDVVLATPLIEKLNQYDPDAQVDFLLRKGNEGLLQGHPFLHKVWIWDKKQGKLRNFFRIIREIRRERYDYVINVHRFFTSGLVTVLSGANQTIGFDKNPLSRFFSKRVKHQITTTGIGLHETQRNLELIAHFTGSEYVRPKLYPSKADYGKVANPMPYVCMAPASVWYTKQWPEEKWVGLIHSIPKDVAVFLLGAPGDRELCERIRNNADHPKVQSLAGQLTFLESAALMEGARMNYVNDSAPLHFASAMNAPVTAIYCSTVPAFGFGPLSDMSVIAETAHLLACRPCGLHGKKSCPEGHFKCADINIVPDYQNFQ